VADGSVSAPTNLSGLKFSARDSTECPGKVFASVILNRIDPRTHDVLRDNQHGFRKERGCRDLIFLMRHIVEKVGI